MSWGNFKNRANSLATKNCIMHQTMKFMHQTMKLFMHQTMKFWILHMKTTKQASSLPDFKRI